MLTFKKRKYPDDMDSEIIELCDAINCIPGIETSDSCCGHGKNPVSVFIDISDPVGMFFLARCTSRRYWKYGHKWSLKADVSDAMKGDMPPVYLYLSSESVGEEAYGEADSLVKNIVFHLNHKNFINGYNLDLSQFGLEGEECGENWWEQIKNL